jgi:hypothetical protein
MPPLTVGFDDVYILSVPSFKWIKWYVIYYLLCVSNLSGIRPSPAHQARIIL